MKTGWCVGEGGKNNQEKPVLYHRNKAKKRIFFYVIDEKMIMLGVTLRLLTIQFKDQHK